jgi:hypothetical protein
MPESLPWTENRTGSRNQERRFESFQWRRGNILTVPMGNVLTATVGKVLDIYTICPKARCVYGSVLARVLA